VEEPGRFKGFGERAWEGDVDVQIPKGVEEGEEDLVEG